MSWRLVIYSISIVLGIKMASLAFFFGNEVMAQNAEQPAPTVNPAATSDLPPEEKELSKDSKTPPLGGLKISESEFEVLQKLALRRKELDERAKKMDMRETLISAAEQRLEQKMAELKALKSLIEETLKNRNEDQEKQMQSLVKMYEAMKPKDAAQIFEELDIDVLLDVVARMSERKVAPILGLVTPDRAKEITVELADRQKLPIAP